MKQFKFLIALAGLALTACTVTPDINFPEGKWVMEAEDQVIIYEEWEKEEVDRYKGKGIIYRLEKELHSEKIEIVWKDEQWQYKAVVKGQNDGKAVYFKLVEQTETRWRFENPDHDYPQVLDYQLTDENHLHVTVGSLNGNASQELFFVRQED